MLKETISFACLTISDTRTQSTDISGKWLIDTVTGQGNECVDYAIARDNCYQIRMIISKWIFDDKINIILTTGGTGFSPTDVSVKAIPPLFDQEIRGFGELFRHYSLLEIGSSAIQSNAIAGIANATLIFCLPGSTNACKTAWNHILNEQLNPSHKPCNFFSHKKHIK